MTKQKPDADLLGQVTEYCRASKRSLPVDSKWMYKLFKKFGDDPDFVLAMQTGTAQAMADMNPLMTASDYLKILTSNKPAPAAGEAEPGDETPDIAQGE